MFSFRILIIACVGLLSLFSIPLAAEQVTLTAVADTSLWEYSPTHNLGGLEMLPVGTIGNDGSGQRSKLLLKFGLAGVIPDNAVISSATLIVHQVRSPQNEDVANKRFYGYQVLFDWGEGDNGYAEPDPQKPLNSTLPAGESEATWTHRKSGQPGELWSMPGGVLDDDFSDNAEFEFFAQQGTNRIYSADLNVNGLDTLNFWRSSAPTNYGWVITVDDERIPFSGRQIASREHPTASFRPQLRINYTVPGPTSPEILDFDRDGDLMTVEYTAGAGVVYRPQYKNNLNGTTWFDLPDQGPLSVDGVLGFTDDVSGADERYYQVIIPSP